MVQQIKLAAILTATEPRIATAAQPVHPTGVRVDGVVVEDSAEIDESMITGESRTVSKQTRCCGDIRLVCGRGTKAIHGFVLHLCLKESSTSSMIAAGLHEIRGGWDHKISTRKRQPPDGSGSPITLERSKTSAPPMPGVANVPRDCRLRYR